MDARRAPAHAALGVTVGAIVLVGSVAHARTLGKLDFSQAAPIPPLAEGSPGTLTRAIADYAKRKRPKRPVEEGAVPAPNPDGVCPDGMANVAGRFCVDRWEGTLESIEDDGSARPWSPYVTPDRAKRYRAVSAPGVVPQAYVNGVVSEAACRTSNKRLCNAAEWRFACAGSRQTAYPYGRTLEPGRCNDRGRSPMHVYYPQVAQSWALVTNKDMNDPRLDKMEGTVAKTGAHAGCVNEWGLYDMVGNLHEWTSDPHGTLQGGYFQDTVENGEGCAYRTTAHDVDYHDYSTGFRCCADLGVPTDGD